MTLAGTRTLALRSSALALRPLVAVALRPLTVMRRPVALAVRTMTALRAAALPVRASVRIAFVATRMRERRRVRVAERLSLVVIVTRRVVVRTGSLAERLAVRATVGAALHGPTRRAALRLTMTLLLTRP